MLQVLILSPLHVSLSISPLCNSNYALFLESERNGECLICFVLVPAPVLDAVIEPVMQVALNPPETPTTPASQAASVQAALLALLSQARSVPISA
jgi:hypothetical protein